ncbi:MAG: cell division protein FtsA [Candidatus Pacebacteria bacterium]|nr:cell division protein FtsA [Candidatus Paceibacterota bacterium]
MRTPIRRISTGIDVGTHTTRVVIMEQVRGGIPRIIGTGSAETKGLRHGYIVNKADATQSIKNAIAQAEKMAELKIKNVFLSVGGISLESAISHGVAIISRAGGEVDEKDLQKASLEAERNLSNITNKRIVHRTPIRYKLDGKEVFGTPCDMIGSKLEVKMLFITYLDQHLQDLIKTVEEAGVEVDEVIPSPIAASQVALSKKERNVGSTLVNIGAETVSIAVFENDVAISLQVFPIGSTDITNDIALGLKIPLEEAESLKVTKTSGSYSKKKLEEIIQARLCDIFELIESHLKKINRNGLLPAGIVLTGGGAGIATIEDLAKGVLKLPSSVARPALANSGKQPVKDSSWLVAYGLADYALTKQGDFKKTNWGDVWGTMKSWVKPFLP